MLKDFLQLERARAPRCGVQAASYGGFCPCRARALDPRASAVVARGLGRCGPNS